MSRYERLLSLADFTEPCAYCNGDGCVACEGWGVVAGPEARDARRVISAWLRDRVERTVLGFFAGLAVAGGLMACALWMRGLGW